MKAYVEESSSQTWHVYEAKKKWRGEAWIKVLTCQCGVTWGMDRNGNRAAVMIMDAAAAYALIDGTKHKELRSTKNISCAADEGNHLTYIARKEDAIWIEGGRNPEQEDQMHPVTTKKTLTIDLTK